MKILYHTDLSREGNDCYIHQSLTLAEEFGLYFIISTFKVIGGWTLNNQAASVSYTFEDIKQAKDEYIRKGGKVK